MSGFNIQSPTGKPRGTHPVLLTAQSPMQSQGIPSFQIYAPPISSDQSSHDEHMRFQTRDDPQSHTLYLNAERPLSRGFSNISVSEPVPTSASYRIPPTPAPSTFPFRGTSGIRKDQNISRQASVAAKRAAHLSAYLLHDAGRKMASRWTSTRSTGRDKRFSLASPGRYDKLEDTEESDLSNVGARAVSQRRGGSGYQNVQFTDEDGPVDAVGQDLSSLDGSVALQPMNNTNSFNAAVDTSQEQTQGALAAEYDQLEADGTFTDGLGGGMKPACLPIDTSRNASANTGAILRRTSGYLSEGLSRGMTVRDVGRMEARRRNHMVMINGISVSRVIIHDEC